MSLQIITLDFQYNRIYTELFRYFRATKISLGDYSSLNHLPFNHTFIITCLALKYSPFRLNKRYHLYATLLNHRHINSLDGRTHRTPLNPTSPPKPCVSSQFKEVTHFDLSLIKQQ